GSPGRCPGCGATIYGGRHRSKFPNKNRMPPQAECGLPYWGSLTFFHQIFANVDSPEMTISSPSVRMSGDRYLSSTRSCSVVVTPNLFLKNAVISPRDGKRYSLSSGSISTFA